MPIPWAEHLAIARALEAIGNHSRGAEVVEQFLPFLQLNSNGLRESQVAQAKQDNFF